MAAERVSWQEADHPTASRRFARNAGWTVLGFVVSLASGLVLSPFIVRTLGAERYGVWALVFALIEYVWLCDLGLRSAVLKFSAQYQAQQDADRVNQVVNTALVYFSIVAAAVSLALAAAFSSLPALFAISAESREEFSFLVLALGASWSLGLVSNVFRASLEGFQRYELLSRITILGTGIRVTGCFAALLMGAGMRGMGIAVVTAQVTMYLLTFLAFRRSFGAFRCSYRHVSADVLLAMARYGAYTTVSTVATLLLNQGPVLLIGRLLSALYVGLYSVPVRLLATMTDAVAQVAMVTVASSADLSARGEVGAVGRLTVVVNRYCLALFLPVSILLWVYGPEIFRLWVGPEVATGSAPLLPILVVGASFGLAGQQNSNAALFGLGKHRGFAFGLMVEGLLCVAGMGYVLPRYGLLTGVAVSTVLLLVNRGIWAPWLVCRYTGVPFLDYMREIYLWPTITAAPILLAASLLKLAGVQGTSWPEIALAAALVGVTYYGLAMLLCLQPDHRASLRSWIGRRKLRRSPAAALAPGK